MPVEFSIRIRISAQNPSTSVEKVSKRRWISTGAQLHVSFTMGPEAPTEPAPMLDITCKL